MSYSVCTCATEQIPPQALISTMCQMYASMRDTCTVSYCPDSQHVHLQCLNEASGTTTVVSMCSRNYTRFLCLINNPIFVTTSHSRMLYKEQVTSLWNKANLKSHRGIMTTPHRHLHNDVIIHPLPFTSSPSLHHLIPFPSPHPLPFTTSSPSLRHLIPFPSPPHPLPFTSSPSLHHLIPFPSPPHPLPFTTSSPSLHHLIPFPSPPHPLPFTTSSPSLHHLIPFPSPPHPLPFTTSSPTSSPYLHHLILFPSPPHPLPFTTSSPSLHHLILLPSPPHPLPFTTSSPSLHHLIPFPDMHM